MTPLSAPAVFAVAVASLAGCGSDDARTAAPTAAVVSVPPAPTPAAGAGPTNADVGSIQDAAAAGAVSPRENDPSAPADTPLCGRAAREAVADAAAVNPAVMAGAGTCAATACFDPLTDTFIGADGYRHVCQ